MKKVGRNDYCPCKSGKKYKHCCKDKNPVAEDLSRNYFDIKGKSAEDIVHFLAEKTFLADWCYKNPQLEKGKELCDILVVFDDVAIIWQIKNLKLQSDGKYKQAEVEKNNRQLIGARKSLLDKKRFIELENTNRGKELFEPQKIKEIFLISALVGMDENSFSLIESYKEQTIHVLSRESTQIILNELNTISDFIHYIRAKEKLLHKVRNIVLTGGEKDLLALYLKNGRDFGEIESDTSIVVQDGCWDNLISSQEYKARIDADVTSYYWDKIISRAHESETREYELVAREMARLTRFERRYFSNAFLEALSNAQNDTAHGNFRRLCVVDGKTYCFLFMDDPDPINRETRKKLLLSMCHVARGEFPFNKLVIGIATEKEISRLRSYDFCLYEKDSWTQEDVQAMKKLKNEGGIFEHPNVEYIQEEEYPTTTNIIVK